MDMVILPRPEKVDKQVVCCLEQAQFLCPIDSVLASMDVQFAIDVLYVEADRVHRDVEVLSNLGARQSGGQ